MQEPEAITLIPADATHGREVGAWSAVSAEGRAFTGAGPARGINDAEAQGALLAVKAVQAGARIVLITDSQALLDAYHFGTGALTGWPVWGDFMSAVRAAGKPWPVIRRAASPFEEQLHRQAHNLAAAAWHAAIEGADPALVAETGWQERQCSNGAIRVARTRHGIELTLLRTPAGEELRALEYEIARLSEVAAIRRPNPRQVIFQPDKKKPQAGQEVLAAMKRLASDPARHG